MLTSIDHINIVVRDLQPAKEFFLDLGFVLQAEKDLEGSWIDDVVGLTNVRATFCALALPGDTTVLELLTYHNPPGQDDPAVSNPHHGGFRHMAFRVDDIDTVYKKLQEKQVHCFSPVINVPGYRGKRLFYFLGPEGIILECAQYE